MIGSKNKTLVQFIGHFLKPYKFWVVAYVLCAMIAGMWGMLNATLMKIIINTLVASKDNSNLMSAMFWPGILFLVNAQVHDFSWRGLSYVNYKIQPILKNDIINNAFAYTCRQSHSFFQNSFAGSIASNISILANGIEKAFNEISMHIIRGAMMLITSLIAMYLVNPQFFIGLLVWSLLFCGLSLLYSTKIINLSNNYAEQESAVSGLIVDALSNSQNVRIFARSNYELSFLGKNLEVLKQKFRIKAMFLLKFNIVQGLCVLALFAYMLYTLIKLRTTGEVTIGDFALIIGLSMDLSWNIWWVMEQITFFNDAIGRSKQSLNALYKVIEIQDTPNATTLQVTDGRVVFHDVHFSYPGTEPLFQNKSITIEPGQKVGLVGYSGGGKTTFVNLILRLYDVNSGNISIDGQDIKTVTQESLYQAIGMIPQDPSLFHRSLIDNIRYGNITATDAEVITCAKSAHAHEFITKLPKGYDSLVGERGIKLSGGQRQRIAIARAILKNAPILILDEATSQLDSITEQEIQDALWELMQDKTSIVIAHRLSTLLHMDRILVFAEGKIVEDGTHLELLAKDGLYKTLWDAQVGGFIAI